MAEQTICDSFAKKQAHAVHFVEETLDVVFHIFILFTALCGLLQFIIGPTYTRVMEQQVDSILQNMNFNLTDKQRMALIQASPMLETVQRINRQRAPFSVSNNQWLFIHGHTISALLFILFLVLIWVLNMMLGAKTWTPTTNVLKNNLLLIFPAILIAEFSFFEIIAMHYSPLLPSDFLNMFGSILEERSIKLDSAVVVTPET